MEHLESEFPITVIPRDIPKVDPIGSEGRYDLTISHAHVLRAASGNQCHKYILD